MTTARVFAQSVREEEARRQEFALEAIKKLIWSADLPTQPVKPVFVMTIKKSKTSFGRQVRYLIGGGCHGPEAVRDITALVCRALGRKWNDKTGNYHIQGGDGTDAINNLSLTLFADPNGWPVYSI